MEGTQTAEVQSPLVPGEKKKKLPVATRGQNDHQDALRALKVGFGYIRTRSEDVLRGRVSPPKNGQISRSSGLKGNDYCGHVAAIRNALKRTN